MFIRHGTPAVITAYSHLTSIHAYLYKIARSYIIDMCMPLFDIMRSAYVVFPLLRIAVVPLVVCIY